MKITVINKRAAGEMPVSCVDSTQCKPGETRVMLGRNEFDFATQMGVAINNEIIVRGQFEAVDYQPVKCVMKKPADPAGGANTVAAEGYDLKEIDGSTDANVAPQMYMGVYSDVACTVPSATGTLATAAKGTIDSGSGTNLIKCTPDATGEFSVTLTDTVDETVYLKAWPVAGDYLIDSSDSHSNTFTP